MTGHIFTQKIHLKRIVTSNGLNRQILIVKCYSFSQWMATDLYSCKIIFQMPTVLTVCESICLVYVYAYNNKLLYSQKLKLKKKHMN